MHIAEKYASLARDAMASGDMVGAENYLQHAEHYNRIIMAAQAQNPNVPGMEGQNGMNGGGRFNPSEPFQRDFDGAGDDEDGDDFVPQKPFNERHDRGHRERERTPNYNQHQQPQPYIPQQASFPQTQQAHQPAAAPVANGDAEHAGDQPQPISAEGERGPRRRRRRPMGEGGKGFNGRNGAHGPAEGLNGAAPNGAASDEAAS